jgi:hypothetical protein
VPPTDAVAGLKSNRHISFIRTIRWPITTAAG